MRWFRKADGLTDAEIDNMLSIEGEYKITGGLVYNRLPNENEHDQQIILLIENRVCFAPNVDFYKTLL